jgi:SAM-dependent methyltransferase
MCPEENPWNPPSSNLLFSDGLWKPAVSRGEVSYPEKGNAFFEKVEHASFWFQHRNRCILEAVHRFFPGGYFYDIGGGNGFVAQTLENGGISTVVLEPGHGAHVARHRGLPRIIQSSLDEAGLREGSLDNAGCFDVIEHLQKDRLFCRRIFGLLKPRGFFFCTVPAGRWLWSEDDVAAGHFRRYSRKGFESLLQEAGFKVCFSTYFFCWMVIPLFFMRAMPSWLHLRKRADFACLSPAESGHILPRPVQPAVSAVHGWELARIQANRPLRMGTSLLVVAAKPAETNP